MGLAFNLLRPDPLPWIAHAKATVSLADLEAPASGETAGVPSAAESSPPAVETAEEPEPHPVPGPEQATPKDQDNPSASAAPAQAEAASIAAPAADPPEPQENPGRDLYPDLPGADLPITVTLAQAREFYDRRGLLVLDAREMEEYGEGHIEGAEPAPYDDKVGDGDWMEKTARDPRPILVYCSGGDCELSHDLAIEICRSGHRRVLILTDGYLGWEEAGHPVAKGAQP